MLKIRTSGGMIELDDREAAELRERLRRLPAAQPAEETIAVAANASTSVAFTQVQVAAVLEVLDQWAEEAGEHGLGAGLLELSRALRGELLAE
ncbi:MAG TPA: hypothetical protein VF002_04605 [Gaiellaceae bacterium]